MYLLYDYTKITVNWLIKALSEHSLCAQCYILIIIVVTEIQALGNTNDSLIEKDEKIQYSFKKVLKFCISYHHLRTCLLILEKEGRGREREGEKHQSERSNWGPNPQPRHVPWLGMELVTFWFVGWCSNQLSHISQGKNSPTLKPC